MEKNVSDLFLLMRLNPIGYGKINERLSNKYRRMAYRTTYCDSSYYLDFLCIHPFRDGNGRTARLLTLLLLYHFDYQVGRYISLERIFEGSRRVIMKRWRKVLKLGTKENITLCLG